MNQLKQVIKQKPEKPIFFKMKSQTFKGGGGKSCCPFPSLPGIEISSVLLIVAELKTSYIFDLFPLISTRCH